MVNLLLIYLVTGISSTPPRLYPRKAEIVVVKTGYPEPKPYARAYRLLAIASGGIDQNIEHSSYHSIQRPMFSLDKEMKEPGLKAKLVLLPGK